MSRASIRRSAAPILAIAALSACALCLVVASAGAASQQGRALVPYIVGGQESSISQFPWQAFVLLDNEAEGKTGSCGGSILDATHILTAAHCVDHEATTSPFPPSDLTVVAGASEVVLGGAISPSSAQQRKVRSLRTHPYYAVTPEVKDDVAVLELATPLELSAARNTAAITLVTAGATPAAGTPLSVSGYGKQQGGEGSKPNGKLYSATLNAVGSDACRAFVGLQSAVLLCAQSPDSTPCQGDSGGPLTEGSPAVQVGVVDYGAKECPVAQPSVFANLAAPEVRVFVEGSEAPPVAARPTSLPVMKTFGTPPVDFSPLTCEPGAWSGSPSLTYAFQVDNSAAQLLQGGAANAFVPPASVIGLPVVCIVQASNSGGVSTVRTGTTPPIALDTVPPLAVITALKCHRQACTLSIAASDPHAVALTLRSSAAYAVTTRCPRRRRGRKPTRRAVCHKTLGVRLPIKALSATTFQASASRLPYGRRIKFSALASNAAGLHQAVPAVRYKTLRKPKPKRRKPKTH
ncbi:MAG TPA: serine protease [Solirubrobacteraceae bacterium]|nr:serine protease [Solirubrobacteraceae bacterium]